MSSTPNLCIRCKGSRLLCGNKTCPLLSKFYLKTQVQPKLKENFYGPSSDIFVGHKGYPSVFIGPLGNLSSQSLSGSQLFSLPYEKIIQSQSLVLRSKLKQSIFSRESFIQDNQLLAISKKPADIEMNFQRKPNFQFSFSSITQPIGISAQLKKLRITENVKVERKVEYIINDDLKSVDSCWKLFNNKQDVYKISNILSSGALGLEKNKKRLVPTRWSITAIDDLIGKQLISQIKTYPSINEYLVFSSSSLGNHFHILLTPGSWEFENFEAWAPGSFWAQKQKNFWISEEYEPYSGRKTYAKEQVGGYYAARLAILEYLSKIKKQARVIDFREISEEYIIPVGVWQVRENVRNAFKNPPHKFPTLKEALDHIGSNIRLPINEYIKKSKLLQQKRVFDFI
ncbi:MAG: hypothetical protein ISS95_00155 [Candidatus Aenigmarchaeota archaeon]|nr:hypothetical protein [Candidatus Aenigmarchaeota archaeon]